MKSSAGWLLVCMLSAVQACQRTPQERCAPDTERPVDDALVAFLGRARSAHHLADQAKEQGDLRNAVSQLEKVVLGPRPSPSKLAPETREVLADTFARITQLRSELGEFNQADRAIEQGLLLAPPGTYFEGYLYEAQGLNEERRAKQLESTRELALASAAKKRAVAAFERAMQIQGAVIEREQRAPLQGPKK